VFREVMRVSHIPYPALWIEWEDVARAELRQKFEQPQELKEIRPYPERFGFLIEADPETDYRSGQITYAWTQKEDRLPGFLQSRYKSVFDDTPNVSAVTTYFNLDGDYPIDFVDKQPLQLAILWEDNPIQHEAFHSIWRTAHHRLNEAAVEPLTQDAFGRALLYADVVGEYIMVWACLMVLAEARMMPTPRPGKNIARVVLRSVDMSKLNKARIRSGKTALLDHRTVHINSVVEAVQMRGPLDYRRKSPRIHLVGSYLGWHGKIVFPYTRGRGPARRR
jgi:hypothetical protein